MAVKVNISITGAKRSLDLLKRVTESLTKLRPEMEAVGRYLTDTYSGGVFESEGQIIGYRWASLSPRYKDWKRTAAPGRGTLEFTGELRRGFLYRATETNVTIGNRKMSAYGKYHMQGTSTMPARPFMGVNERQHRHIAGIISDSLHDRLRRLN